VGQGIVNLGNNAADSSYLTNVEKRAITRYAGRIQYSEPEMIGPLFDPINWFLPYTYKVLNRWIRYYDRFDPWIGNAIDMHSEVPLSRFTLTGIDDPVVQREYEEIVDALELYQRLLEMTREYWLLGEAFPFAHWNNAWLAFDQLVNLNPDYIAVNASPLVHGRMVQYEMEPDDSTIAIVKSNEPRDQEIRELLDPVVINAVESGTNIPLDSFNTSHIARKASPYDLRGTSILLRCLKDMLYCLVPGTKVVMGDGTWKNIEDIKIGDGVFTHTGKIKRVESTMHHTENEIVRVHMSGQSEIVECTVDHEFLVWASREYCECGCGQRLTPKARKRGKHFVGSGPHIKDSEWVKLEETFEWRRADQLQAGDYLCVPVTGACATIKKPVYKKGSFEVEITPGIVRLLGYFLAEGSYRKNKGGLAGLQFTFNFEERSTWASDVCQLCEKELGIVPIVHAYEKHNSCTVFFSNRFVAEMFYYYCGEYSHDKEMPAEVMEWSLDLQGQLLIGYLRGDGSCKYNLSFGSASRKLAEQISSILRNLGIDHVIYPSCLSAFGKHPTTTVNITKTTSGVREFFCRVFPQRGFDREIKSHAYIVKSIQGFGAKGLTQKETCLALVACGIAPPRGERWDPVQIKRIEQRGECIVGSRDASVRFRKGDYIVHPIKKVEKVSYNGDVHCLDVEEDHSFLVYKGVVVHNCDKLREAQMAVADRLITPLQVFRLGDPHGEWLPSQEQIDQMASLLAQGRDDPNFALVGHFGLQVEYVGAAGKVLPIVPEFDFVRDRILAALFTNRAMIEGAGPTFANASIAFEILQLRYMALRGILELFVQHKLFRPIAEARGYYVPLSTAELEHGIRPSKMSRELVIPDINWLEKIRLLDDVQIKRFILQLRMRMDVPLETVCEIFDLDYNHIRRQLAEEIGTPADPVWRQAVSRAVAGSWEREKKPGQKPVGLGAPGAIPGGAMPGMAFPGETFPGAMEPAPREVAPEGGTTPGGPELPGARPEEIGPGAGAGIAAGMRVDRLDVRDVQDAFELKEELERKRLEAIKQLQDMAKADGDGKMTRKVFGVAKSSNKYNVYRDGSSFYTVDR
jgi:hypothetical protein